MKALRKIILIDDDEDFCYLHKLQLEEKELAKEVLTITDSWQALQFILSHFHKKELSEHEPDLILLDLNMPGMTGFELLQDLENLKVDQSKIVIIILTASSNPQDRQKAASFGKRVSGYLTKPLQVKKLEAMLEELS